MATEMGLTSGFFLECPKCKGTSLKVISHEMHDVDNLFFMCANHYPGYIVWAVRVREHLSMEETVELLRAVQPTEETDA